MSSIPSPFTPFEALSWTPWQPLQDSWNDRTLPEHPGLYRIRRRGREELDYVGQTGRALRQRLGDLRGIYRSEMPYRAPHTVGPALWALLHGSACTFEVSVAAVVGSDPYRKGMEALVIAAYRQQMGYSPTVNFGRMPTGYKMSSDNNTRLATLGLRYRGGPSEKLDISHLPGLPPPGRLDGPWHPQWCGLSWSPWLEIGQHKQTMSSSARGLYLLRGAGTGELLYIGQGRIQSRLTQHDQKQSQLGHPQGEIFKAHGGLQFSSTAFPDAHSHQLLELENDLIAAFLYHQKTVPKAQFLGEGKALEQVSGDLDVDETHSGK